MKFAAHIEARNSPFVAIRLVRTVGSRTILVVSCGGYFQGIENMWDTINLAFVFGMKRGPGAFGNNIAVTYITRGEVRSRCCVLYRLLLFGGK